MNESSDSAVGNNTVADQEGELTITTGLARFGDRSRLDHRESGVFENTTQGSPHGGLVFEDKNARMCSRRRYLLAYGDGIGWWSRVRPQEGEGQPEFPVQEPYQV